MVSDFFSAYGATWIFNTDGLSIYYMKDWEISRVNELFKRVDALQVENNKLKDSGADRLVNLLKAMEDRLDRLSDRLDTVSGNVDDVLVKLDEIKCKCVEEKPTRQYNKKTK